MGEHLELARAVIDQSSAYTGLKMWILRLPGVKETPHRFGGTEFQVDGLEFMHSHGPSFLDIRLSREDQAAQLKNGSVLPHRFAPQAGWVSFRIDKTEDVELAKKIIQLAYDNAKTTMDSHKARQSQGRAVRAVHSDARERTA
jgi:luciferase-like monooxygenase